MKWLTLIALVLLGLYLAVTAFIYFNQRNLLYHPPQTYLTPEAVGLDGFVETPIRGKHGESLLAWWSPPANETDKVVMFFHGNGSAVYSNYEIYGDLATAGIGVLGVAYPGYPGSDGAPTQETLVDAAIAHREFLLAQGITPERIVYHGTSLGSGIAAQLTKRHPPSLLLMDAPFNSVVDMAADHMPFLPVKWLMKDKFQSGAALQGLDVPMIWMHGTADEIVPLAQGQALYDGYEGPRSAHIIDGGRHTNLWGLGGREIVLEALRDINAEN